MKYAYITNKGIKDNNEDSILIGNAVYTNEYNGGNDDICLFGVSDGVSSNKGGNIASFELLKAFKELSIFNLEEIKNTIHKAQDEINGIIKDNPQYKEMSATLSLVYIKNNNLSIYNLGDSLIKIYSEGLYNISKAHTLENDLKNAFLVEDNNNVNKHVITKYFCGDKMFDGYYKENISINNGEYILISSDGLTDVVNDSIISNVIKSESSLTDKVKGLYDIALKRGSLDNISIILIEV